MKKTTIELPLERELKVWMTSITNAALEEFFDILENQQIHNLKTQESDPARIQGHIRTLEYLKNQLKSLKTKSSQ